MKSNKIGSQRGVESGGEDGNQTRERFLEETSKFVAGVEAFDNPSDARTLQSSFSESAAGGTRPQMELDRVGDVLDGGGDPSSPIVDAGASGGRRRHGATDAERRSDDRGVFREMQGHAARFFLGSSGRVYPVDPACVPVHLFGRYVEPLETIRSGGDSGWVEIGGDPAPPENLVGSTSGDSAGLYHGIVRPASRDFAAAGVLQRRGRRRNSASRTTPGECYGRRRVGRRVSDRCGSILLHRPIFPVSGAHELVWGVSTKAQSPPSEATATEEESAKWGADRGMVGRDGTLPQNSDCDSEVDPHSLAPKTSLRNSDKRIGSPTAFGRRSPDPVSGSMVDRTDAVRFEGGSESESNLRRQYQRGGDASVRIGHRLLRSSRGPEPSRPRCATRAGSNLVAQILLSVHGGRRLLLDGGEIFHPRLRTESTRSNLQTHVDGRGFCICKCRRHSLRISNVGQAEASILQSPQTLEIPLPLPNVVKLS